MLQHERQSNILDYLERHHGATVKELAAAVYASEASVRRDIAKLEAMGRLERIYGGVLLATKHIVGRGLSPAEMQNIANIDNSL